MMKILIVDDHPATRLGLTALLMTTGEIAVVGEAKNASEAVRQAHDLAPDIVVLDLRLQGETSGIEACREIKSLPSPPRIIMHTAYNMAEDISSCQLSGAESFVHKSEESAKLLEAIRCTYAGQVRWFLGEEDEGACSRLWSVAEKMKLTAKEKEIFALLITRRTNPEIANALYMSPLTVKTHVANILRKMGLKSRRQIC